MKVNFEIKIEDAEPKKAVTVMVDGKTVFFAHVKVTSEQVLDNLTRFFLQCVREDIALQEDIERHDAGVWK